MREKQGENRKEIRKLRPGQGDNMSSYYVLVYCIHRSDAGKWKQDSGHYQVRPLLPVSGVFFYLLSRNIYLACWVLFEQMQHSYQKKEVYAQYSRNGHWHCIQSNKQEKQQTMAYNYQKHSTNKEWQNKHVSTENSYMVNRNKNTLFPPA